MNIIATGADLGWVAGLIDGEGCIHIQESPPSGHEISPRFKLSLTVTNTDRPTLERFMRIVGCGNIYNRTNGSNWKTCYHWKCSKNHALEILRQVRSCLVTRAEQADLAFEFADIGGTHAPIYGVPNELTESRREIVGRLQATKGGKRTGKLGRPRTHEPNETRGAIYRSGYGRGAYKNGCQDPIV